MACWVHCKDKMPKIWNKYSQKRNIGASVSISTFMRLWANYIFPRWVCLFCWKKYVDRSWEYINRSQTHECGNWGLGCTIPRKGIYKWPPIFLVTASSKVCLASLIGMWSASALRVGVWMELPLGVQNIWQAYQETLFQSQLSEAVAEMWGEMDLCMGSHTCMLAPHKGGGQQLPGAALCWRGCCGSWWSSSAGLEVGGENVLLLVNYLQLEVAQAALFDGLGTVIEQC